MDKYLEENEIPQKWIKGAGEIIQKPNKRVNTGVPHRWLSGFNSSNSVVHFIIIGTRPHAGYARGRYMA